jgi:hypothetical protein
MRVSAGHVCRRSSPDQTSISVRPADPSTDVKGCERAAQTFQRELAHRHGLDARFDGFEQAFRG